MSRITVSLQEPVPVAYSAPGETRWGFHQFPALGRMPDGTLMLMYADAEDASETHGKPAPSFISRDEGASWTPMPDGDLQPTRPHFSISQVFDGEYLCVPSMPYLDTDADGIALPDPVSVGNTYGKVCHYRLEDLPLTVKNYFRYLPARRWIPSLQPWQETTVEYDVEGLLAWQREHSSLLPRTFFERTLLPYDGELFYADYRARYTAAGGFIPSKGFTSLMVSEDNGHTFRRRSTVAMDPANRDLMGEPHLSMTTDHRLVCVVRRTDQEQKPMGITWSSDHGHTWSPLQRLFDFGVWPCLLLLGNGTLVLSYGRPGVHLAFDPGGTGEDWAVRTTLIGGEHTAINRHTCGYTSLIALDQDSFLIAYSDFLHERKDGIPCKAIFTRHIQVRRSGD